MIAQAIGVAFGLTFIAEMGDKTQIAVLTLSARYGWRSIFLGASAAFVLLDAISVTLGELAARYVPADVVRYVAAAIFIIFGLLSFRRIPEGTAEKPTRIFRHPFVTAFLYICILEIGDKTQLALIALTSRFKAPFWVFLGGTMALILATLIGALVGRVIERYMPVKWVRWASGVIFLVMGILMATGVL